MRIKAMWTLVNETDKQVYWALYEPDDKVYVAAWEKQYGTIDAGRAVDFEASVAEAQIVFWESEPTFGFGTKVGGPVTVKTDRPVRLTKQKRVTQEGEPQFKDPARRVGGAVGFMDGISVNNVERGLVVAIAGKIPQVGGAIASAIEFLWPEEKPDLIKESEERLKSWVRGQIAAYDRKQLESHLLGLQANLHEYVNATSPGERRRWLDVCLGACNYAKPFFFKSMSPSDYTPGTVALVVKVAVMHLALLRERVLFSREIFGDEQVDFAMHREQFKEGIASYQRFLHEVAVPRELEWRANEIQVQAEHGPYHQYVKDWVTREVHAFHKSGRNQLNQGPATVCVEMYRAQAISDYLLELRHNVLEPALLWSLLDPDYPTGGPPPLEARFWAGPYAGLPYMSGNEHDWQMYDSVEDMGSRVTNIVVREGALIDALQIGFDGAPGRVVGNATGGAPHDVKVPAGALLTEIETWWDFDLFAVRFHFSDGSSSRTFGTPARGGVHQRARHPDHYISGVRIGNRMHELYVAYSPMPDYMKRIAAQAQPKLDAAEKKRAAAATARVRA